MFTDLLSLGQFGQLVHRFGQFGQLNYRFGQSWAVWVAYLQQFGQVIYGFGQLI